MEALARPGAHPPDAPPSAPGARYTPGVSAEYDVIVLGGGANGTGVARDCAMRGLRVLLLERADFGVGASGNSSGMIHGGIRYMLSDRKVTALACRDSGYIQRIAPHLLFRIPFLMPFAARSEGATLVDRATWYATEVYVGTYDLYQPLKRGKPSARLSPQELYALEPGLRPGLAGAVTLDEWGIDAFRLCALNALDAEARGAEVRTWTEARELLREGGRVRGVRCRDVLTGEEGEAHAPVVFNATGAWSPALARRSGVRVPMRPGKGVHLTLDRRYSNYGVICAAVDGRQMFLMPHENESIVGTTDDDYYGDPDDLEATNDEVEYLLEGAASLVPGVRDARVTRAWCGLRTTLYEYGPNEDALSREHQLHDGAADGLAGLLSFVGGKLASLPRAGGGGDRPDPATCSAARAVPAARTRCRCPAATRCPTPRARAQERARRGAGRGAARLPAREPRPRDPPPRRRRPAARPRPLPRRGDPRRGGGLLRAPREGAAAAGPAAPLPGRARRVRRAWTARASRRSSPGASSAGTPTGSAPSWRTCSTRAGGSGGRPRRRAARAGGARPRRDGAARGALVTRALDADLLVVGGGMAGPIAALAARCRGRRVVLVAPRAGRDGALLGRGVGRARPRRALPGEPLASRRPPIEAAGRLARRPARPPVRDRRGGAARRGARLRRRASSAPLLAPPLERRRFLATLYGSAVSRRPRASARRRGRSPRGAGDPRRRGVPRPRSPSTRGSSRRGSSATRRAAGRRCSRSRSSCPASGRARAGRTSSRARSTRPGRRRPSATRSGPRCPPDAGAALLPPVLGPRPGARARRSGSPRGPGVPVAETLSDVPSVPGLRLQRALEARLAAAGIEVRRRRPRRGARAGEPGRRR